MPNLNINKLNSVVDTLDLETGNFTVFIETGTGDGNSIKNIQPYFDDIYTIEIKKDLYENFNSNFNYENVSILNSNISYDNYRNKKNYNTLNDFIEYFIEYYVAYYIGDNLPKERDKLIEYKNLGYNKFVSHWIVYTQNKFILQ